MYKLTKRTLQCYDQRVPVLMSNDGCGGPYRGNDTLQFAAGSTAADFVRRHVLKELKKTDCPLEVDPGENLTEYGLQFLLRRVSDEVRREAVFIAKLKERGIEYEKYIET